MVSLCNCINSIIRCWIVFGILFGVPYLLWKTHINTEFNQITIFRDRWTGELSENWYKSGVNFYNPFKYNATQVELSNTFVLEHDCTSEPTINLMKISFNFKFNGTDENKNYTLNIDRFNSKDYLKKIIDNGISLELKKSFCELIHNLEKSNQIKEDFDSGIKEYLLKNKIPFSIDTINWEKDDNNCNSQNRDIERKIKELESNNKDLRLKLQNCTNAQKNNNSSCEINEKIESIFGFVKKNGEDHEDIKKLISELKPSFQKFIEKINKISNGIEKVRDKCFECEAACIKSSSKNNNCGKSCDEFCHQPLQPPDKKIMNK